MPRPVTLAVRPGARCAAVAILVAAAAAGCGMGALPVTNPPSASAPPTTASVSTPPPTPVPPAPTPGATAVDALTEPPAATVSGIASGAGAAALGSFTWDGSGSDAPWIVPPDASRATPGAALAVAFAPAESPVEWTARWAPVTRSGVGDVASGVDGAGPVTVTAPGAAGPWSLQLEASFGQGRSATWYWRVEVVP